MSNQENITFQMALKIVKSLPESRQEELIAIIRQSLIEHRPALFAENIGEASEEYTSGEVNKSMDYQIDSIPLDSETAQIYTQASTEDKQKLRLLLSLWLREYAVPPRPLKKIMDEISDKAQARGLTTETLELLLHGK
jgi:hypothetical protein